MVAGGAEPAPLRAVLGHAGYRRWLVAAQATRLPGLMAALAFVLAGAHATGGYAAGGVMVAAYEVGSVAASLFAGRYLDQRGLARGAVRLLALAALAGTVALRAPAPALVALAALTGALPAGVGGALRALLSAILPPRLLPAAVALDATVVDLLVFAAPLLVALVALAAPPAALAAMALLTLLAAGLLRGLPAPMGGGGRTTPPPPPAARAPWRGRRFGGWLLVSLAFGLVAGTAEVGALPLAARLGGGAGVAAGLVAALALTSAASGLAYAVLAHRLAAPPARQAAPLLATLALGCAGLALAGGWGAALAALALLGLATAPLNTVRSVGAEAAVPAGRLAEGFSVLFALNNVGFGLAGLLLAALPPRGAALAGVPVALVALVGTLTLLRDGGAARESAAIETPPAADGG